jgi:two-component system, chemotaxis family, chemotaxis protein CheY
VYQATNGAEAVALAAKLDASLIMLDIKMPRLDGLQACAQIRELPGYNRTPIVMLTFQDNSKAQVSASRAGATMFLIKPFGMATLMLALSRFLPIDEMTQKTIYADAVRATGGRVFLRPNS